MLEWPDDIQRTYDNAIEALGLHARALDQHFKTPPVDPTPPPVDPPDPPPDPGDPVVVHTWDELCMVMASGPNMVVRLGSPLTATRTCTLALGGTVEGGVENVITPATGVSPIFEYAPELDGVSTTIRDLELADENATGGEWDTRPVFVKTVDGAAVAPGTLRVMGTTAPDLAYGIEAIGRPSWGGFYRIKVQNNEWTRLRKYAVYGTAEWTVRNNTFVVSTTAGKEHAIRFPIVYGDSSVTDNTIANEMVHTSGGKDWMKSCLWVLQCPGTLEVTGNDFYGGCVQYGGGGDIIGSDAEWVESITHRQNNHRDCDPSTHTLKFSGNVRGAVFDENEFDTTRERPVYISAATFEEHEYGYRPCEDVTWDGTNSRRVDGALLPASWDWVDVSGKAAGRAEHIERLKANGCGP